MPLKGESKMTLGEKIRQNKKPRQAIKPNGISKEESINL
jgi:hypothetical protein